MVKIDCMKNKVTLSFNVSQETRKLLKTMAVNEDKTMAALVEEMIIMKWQQTSITDKNGII